MYKMKCKIAKIRTNNNIVIISTEAHQCGSKMECVMSSCNISEIEEMAMPM